MKTLKDFSTNTKRILVRCDFNVPLDKKGNILDDFRIKEVMPTIEYLVEQKARIILMSHLGEPNGEYIKELKMDKVGEKLSEYLGFGILKEDDCIGPDIESRTLSLEPGKVMLLENLRFHKEETERDTEFSKKLSFLGDIYVNDAFPVCHRDHASITGVPKFLSPCAGLLLEKELKNLDKILQGPQRPFVAVVGGAKVETKAKFIDSISEIADLVIVSGLIKKEILEKNIQFKHADKIIGPENNLDALDIDKSTAESFREKILQAKTVLWNGPFGKFEEPPYAAGTLAIAKAIIESKAFSIAGGGETVEFLEKQGIIQKFSHVSTGGGAMLSYLAKEELPGLKALETKDE